jgi:pilus assembly protein CpaB
MTMKKTLFISIACGILAVIMSALYLHMKELEVAGGGQLQEVLVAVADIKQQTLIEPGLVKIKKVPKIFVQPGALRSWKEGAGRVSLVHIKRGEQILGTKLVMGGAAGGLSSKVPSGKRAVSIAMSESNAAAGLVRPDDYVDVVVTFDYGDQGSPDKYTYTLFQNVNVLAVGSKTHSIRNPKGVVVVEEKSNGLFGSSSNLSQSRSKDVLITFALNPDKAQQLIFANQAGRITLALRSPTDRANFKDLSPVAVESLTGKAGFVQKNYKEYRW